MTVPAPGVPRRDRGPVAPEDLALLSLVARGLTTAAVARRLGVSERTVRRRLQGTLRTLEVGTPIEAVVVAVRRGLI